MSAGRRRIKSHSWGQLVVGVLRAATPKRLNNRKVIEKEGTCMGFSVQNGHMRLSGLWGYQ